MNLFSVIRLQRQKEEEKKTRKFVTKKILLSIEENAKYYLMIKKKSVHFFSRYLLTDTKGGGKGNKKTHDKKKNLTQCGRELKILFDDKKKRTFLFRYLLPGTKRRKRKQENPRQNFAVWSRISYT